jgi:hypothetical protein
LRVLLLYLTSETIILKVVFVCLLVATANAVPKTFFFGYPCALCSFIDGGVTTSDSNYSEAETTVAMAARLPVSVYHV